MMLIASDYDLDAHKLVFPNFNFRIAVPLALRGDGNRGSPDRISGINDGSPTAAPHQKHITATPVAWPTHPPTMAPTMSYINQARDYLITYGLVDPNTLADSSTPQAKAFEWITNEVGYKEEIDMFAPELGGDRGAERTVSRFAERYSLAVLYYSTGGDSGGWRYKLNFLEPIDHCDWFERFVDPTGSIIKQGVTECKMFAPKFDGYKVSQIEICKCVEYWHLQLESHVLFRCRYPIIF